MTKHLKPNLASLLGGLLLGAFFLLLAPNTAQATHALGADLTYECTGSPNQYLVRLKFFRDCDGIAAPSSASIQVRYASNNVFYTTLSLLKVSVNDITPLCPGETSTCNGGTVDGVEEHVYEGVIPLPSDIFSLQWRLCCRNNVITNLSNPGSDALFVSTVLDNTLSGCNNSPTFGNQALAFGCVNEAISYNHGASDVDGDELQFSFTACLEAFNDPVDYSAGFSAINPLTTASGTTINPNTGQISFTPTTEQVSVVCVKVEEFRNGVKIGEVTRDIQFDIEDCGVTSNKAPTADTGADPNPKSATIGVQVCMEVNASDSDGDNIWIERGSGIPTGTFTPALPTEAAPVAGYSGQFCWTPQIADAGTNFLTLRITDDACPTSRFTDFTLEFDVNCTAPTVTCPGDQTGALDASCAFELPDYSNLVSTTGGDCGPYTVTQTPAAGTTYNAASSVPVTLQVTDANGATVETCNLTLTVADQAAPTLTCPGDITVDNDADQCTAVVNFSATVEDNCDADPSVTYSIASGTGFDVGATTVTVDAGDATGNSATQCSFTVTVNDAQSPVPDVADLPAIDVDCSVSLTAPTATDNCAGTITGTAPQTSFTTQGSYTVTWTYDDGNGNVITQDQSVTVSDSEAPSITCPADVTVDADNDACSAASLSLGNPTATDNCGTPTVTSTPIPASFPVGTTALTYTATDANGQSSSCVQFVTVKDATTPSLDCQPITVDNDQDACGAIVTFAIPAFSDECGATPSLAGYSYVGELDGHHYFLSDFLMEWSQAKTAADGLGGYLVSITSQAENDFIATGISGQLAWIGLSDSGTEGTFVWESGEPLNFTSWGSGEPNNAGNEDFVEINRNGAGQWNDLPAGFPRKALVEFESFGLEPSAANAYASGDFFPVGTTTLSFTATDLAGNTTSCNLTVTVNDAQAPSISNCPGDIVVNNDPGQCGAVVTFTPPSFTDNCSLTPDALSGYTSLGDYNGSRYFLSNAAALSINARNAAAAAGGHLATITSAGENTFLANATAGVQPWVGFSDRALEGDFVWETGEAILYTNWLNGEPNNLGDEDFTVINFGGSGLWNDENNAFERRWIVEFDGLAVLEPNTGKGSGSFYPVGTTTVEYQATDLAGNSVACSFTVTVNDNEGPAPDVDPLPAISEECSVTLTAPTATDNCTGAVTATTTGPTTYSDLGTYTVTWTYDDGNGNNTTQDQTVTVFDATAPVIGGLTLPSDPAPLGTSSSVSATFTDGCDKDDHTASWEWGDGTSSTGTVAQTGNTVSGDHAYLEAGVYVVTLTVTDGSGNFDTEVSTTYIVIYDPNGNFVTGGGWIDSPAGAYTPDPGLTGHANFGFVSKYQNGANVPTGNTVFKFNAANFKFKSSSYEWLVVAGANAKFKGDGTVNNSGNYGFMVTGVDGDINGGGGVDKFRIKIWDKDNGDAIVYDNQMGSDDTGYDTQGLAGGSIQIHGNNGGGNGNGNNSAAEEDPLAESQPRRFANQEVDVLARDFQFSPNPASSFLNLDLSAYQNEDVTLVIFTQAGVPVWRQQFLQLEQAILRVDLSPEAFPAGYYLVSLISKDGRQARPLIITR